MCPGLEDLSRKTGVNVIAPLSAIFPQHPDETEFAPETLRDCQILMVTPPILCSTVLLVLLRVIHSLVSSSGSSVRPFSFFRYAKGRGVVAVEPIVCAEVIAVEDPLLHVSNRLELEHCGHCLRFTPFLVPCQGCNQVLYCSDECRQEAR